MNPNHPHYAGLGGGPNLNLLDNMLMAAGFQVSIWTWVIASSTYGTAFVYRCSGPAVKNMSLKVYQKCFTVAYTPRTCRL